MNCQLHSFQKTKCPSHWSWIWQFATQVIQSWILRWESLNFFRCHLSIPKRSQRIARYVIYCDMNFGSSSSHVPTVTGKWVILAENLLSSEKMARLNLGQKSSKSSGYVSQKQWPKRSQTSNQNTFSGIGFSTNQVKFSYSVFFFMNFTSFQWFSHQRGQIFMNFTVNFWVRAPYP